MSILPQLISRIAHSNSTIYDELKSILVKLLCDFPQQTLWYLISQKNSSHSLRSLRATQIFEAAIVKKPEIKKLVEDMIKLATLLLDMCTKKIPHSTQSIYSTSDYFPTLLKTVNSPNFSRIIIPTESQLKLFGFEERSQEKLVYIESIGSKFEMLNSLVRPKNLLSSAQTRNPTLCSQNRMMTCEKTLV